MMRRFKQLLTVFLAIVVCVTTIVPVHAATPVTQDGITLTVTPDKTSYSQGETITATVKVENTNNFAVTDVSLEGITPEGYELKLTEGDSLTIGELAANSSKELVVSFVPKDVIIYFKENFEYEGDTPDYFVSSWTAPQGIANANKTGTTVKPAADGTDNKALNIIGTSVSGAQGFQVDARWSSNTSWSDSASVSDLSSKFVVYEVDIKLNENPTGYILAQLRSVNASGSGAFSTLFNIENNVLMISGMENKTLTAGVHHNIAVVCDFAEGIRDVYLNGERIANDIVIDKWSGFNSAKVNDFVRLTFWKAVDTDILIDNLAVYESKVPVDIDFEETENGGEGGEGTKEPVEVTEGEKIFATDLELSDPFVTAAHENVIQWIDEPGNEENKVIWFQRRNATDFHIDLKGLNTNSDSVVYDFDVKLLNASETMFRVLLKDDDAKYSTACSITEGGNITDRAGQLLETDALKDNEWNNIAVVYDYKNRVSSIYINGTVVAEDIAMETTFGGSDKAGLLRFYCPNLDATTEGFDINNHNVEFMIDNVRVYEGTKPSEELTEAEVVITINPDKSIFDEVERVTSKNFDTMLSGYMSLHTRNGMVYYNGNKTLLVTKPVETENGFLVVAREICDALGINYTINGDTAEINGKQAVVTNKGGTLWIDAQYFFETILEKTVSIDEAAKSDGMMIAGDSDFTWPTTVYASESVYSSRTELQNLNDYLFFERPTAEVLTSLYASSELKGVHPRIQVTAEDFKRVKAEIETNTLMGSWYQQLIVAADYLVEKSTTALKYELRDGRRLLQVSRDMLDHMYTLGMAYQLTGDSKYVGRAWIDLYAVSNFPDWHPEHDLDPAEMAAAVAIGYDWMYHGLSEAQRETIEKGIYKNCFQDAVDTYQRYESKIGASAICGINHNIVINGGFAMGALAFMDEYPEVSSYILSGAIRAADIMLTEYGPDGAWKEGPHYWEYATQYTSKMLSSLETVFGTCFSLDACEGLSTAANFILNMQSDQGIFNYGDGTQSNYYVPEMFWLSNKYGDKSVTSTVLGLNHGKMSDNENVVLSLLWYDTDIAEGAATMPLDGAYYTEGVATFRDSWTDGVTAFAGIHGGYTRICHAQVDGGTFVYDYAGIRWAKDLGITPYDTEIAADYSETGGRWLLWRSRAEAHNTIVINPDASAGQKIESTAKLTRFESDNKGGIAVLDMSENYADNATSAIRGLFFTDDRTSLVVRDEISLSKDDSTVYWFMHTDAAVEIAEDGKSATLTQGGKKVTLEFKTSGTGTATLSYGPSTRALLGSTSPLANTSEASEDKEDSAVNRIAIKLSGASGNVAITTKLTPEGVNSTPVEDYHTSIATWAVPKGEIAAKPTVQSVVIDGREIKFDSANQATFLCVEGKYETIPTPSVTVDETKYTYEVVNASATDGGATTIIVKDKNNADVYTTYTVNLEEIPVAAVPDEDRFAGMTALQIIAVEASEEPEANVGNVAWKTLDQKTATSWTAQGIGHWILLELEKEATVDDLIILFKRGNVRSTYFNVSVSTDGVNYEQLFTGESAGTKLGNAEAYEQFDLGGKPAKYIRIGCNGNSADLAIGWNNISEIVFTGTVVEKEPSEIPTIKLEMTDTSYTKFSKDETVAIYCTGEHTELVAVYMNNEMVDESNYTVKKGSTIVEFKKEYLENLPVGNYTVKLRYTGNREVTSSLEIKAIPAPTEGPASTPGSDMVSDTNNNSGNNDASNNAEETAPVNNASGQIPTGDNGNPLLWSIVMLTAIGGALFLSVVYRKRFKGILSLVLVCVLLAGMIPNALNVYAEGIAESNTKTLTATENVTVGESTVSIGFKLTYTLPEKEPSVAPIITIGTQPKAAEVKVGEKATLTVAATATENAQVSYQWYSCDDANKTNAAAITTTGATGDTYEVTPATVGAVYYYCVVSAEGATSVESSVVAVTATAEVSDKKISFQESFDADNFSFINWSGNGATYGITRSASGSCEVIGDTTDKALKILGTVTGNLDVRFSDDTSWSDATSVTNLAGKDIIYKFDLKITKESGTNFTVTLRSVDDASSGQVSYLCGVTNNVLKIEGSTSTKQLSIGEYTIEIACDFGETGTDDKEIRTVYVNGEPLATDVTMHRASNFNVAKVNDLLRFMIAESSEYYLDNIQVFEQTSEITIDKEKTTSTSTVEVGKQATLNVVATATNGKTLTYQWYSCADANKTNATAIAGATSATYEVTATAVGTSYYFCELFVEGAVSIVTDAVAVTAEAASVTPVITIGTQPTAAEVKVGEATTLTVAATATENAQVSYQWYSCEDADKTNAAAISGATGATYEVTPATASDVYYYCVVSAEGATSVASEVVAVTVPVLYSQNFASLNTADISAWDIKYGMARNDVIATANGFEIVASEASDKELKFKGVAKNIYTNWGNLPNIDARFSKAESAWADKTSHTKLSEKAVAYEFTVKITQDTAANLIVQLRSVTSTGSGAVSQLCKINNNTLQLSDASGGTINLQSLTTGAYKIKIICDFKTKTRDIYINDNPVTNGINVTMHNQNTFNAEQVNDLLRFTIPANTVTCDVCVDDILIYEVVLPTTTE